MTIPKIPLAWRTAFVVLALAVLLLIAFVISLFSDKGRELFPTFANTDATLAGIAALKSGVEHLATNGGGIKGAVKSLFGPKEEAAPDNRAGVQS